MWLSPADPPPAPWMRRRRLLVDAHVHMHACHPAWDVVAAALENFRRASRELGLPRPIPGCLLLAERAGEDYLRRLRGSPAPAGFEVRSTAEEGAVLVFSPQDPPLTLVRGRQVVAEEGLEVLALACDDRALPDGLPLERLLDAVREARGVPVVPWGVGKWWLRRGLLVRRLLRSAEAGSLFLGDNGGRPGFLPTPPLFRTARRRGIRVLPGSDPLPLEGQERRAGAYGFVTDFTLDPARPLSGARRLLNGLHAQPVRFGRGAGPVEFARSQLALRVGPPARPISEPLIWRSAS